MDKLSNSQVVHVNSAKIAHINDAVAKQVEAIAANEKMPAGLVLGDRYGNTAILDFDTDSANDREDDISDDEYSDHDDKLDDDHSLTIVPVC